MGTGAATEQSSVMDSQRRSRLILLSAAIAGLVLAGCSIGDDGPRTTQTREVAEFTRIDNRDAVDVDLRVGEPQRVRVRAGRKVIDDVDTEVRNGTLHLTFDRESFGTGDVAVEASVPKLSGIEVSGSGDVEAEGIDADAFELRSDGSADIAVAGTTGQLTVDLDGSGDTDLAGLAAREAWVASDGSGDTEVRAQQRLEVDLDGSGDVRVHGDPPLTRRVVDGSGELSRAD